MAQHTFKEDILWGTQDPKIHKIWLLVKDIASKLDRDDLVIDEADFRADRMIDELSSTLLYYRR